MPRRDLPCTTQNGGRDRVRAHHPVGRSLARALLHSSRRCVWLITGLMRTDNQDDGGTLHTSARRALEPTHIGSSQKEKAASHKRIVAPEEPSPLSVTASSSPQRRPLPIAALIGNLTTWRVAFVIPGAFSIAAAVVLLAAFPFLGSGVRVLPRRRLC